ncbi:pyridoxal phosphate-dependent transferase [Mycena floridula]|nr:pyridoxal phosphate-dependent transferase [Mycena floridula]
MSAQLLSFPLLQEFGSPELYLDNNPPPFGHQVLKYFSLDPNVTYLGHGGFGATPLPVSATVTKITDYIEANPDRFFKLAFQSMLVSSRERIARFVNAGDMEEVVFVPNASHGLNTVMRNFQWTQDDFIVLCNVTYDGMVSAVQHISDLPPHPQQARFDISFPTSHAEIIDRWRKFIHDLRQSHRSLPKGTGPKIVALIDAFVANPAIWLPWKEMVNICKEEEVWSVVDAAHSLGHEIDIDLQASDPDFWISDCHKWLYAKRSSAVLYVPKRNQHIIKTTFPTSYAYTTTEDGEASSTFVSQFEWPAMTDIVAYLSIPAALDFREWLGGEDKINQYCRELAMKGGRRVAEILDTELLDKDGEFTGNISNIALPIPGRILPNDDVHTFITQKLLIEHKISAFHYCYNAVWYVCANTQIYNEVDGFTFPCDLVAQFLTDVQL